MASGTQLASTSFGAGPIVVIVGHQEEAVRAACAPYDVQFARQKEQRGSEGVRANLVGDNRAVALAREAVALDSTFATAWSSLGAMLSNYGGTQSAIDSALTQAYRYRDRVPPRERDMMTAAKNGRAGASLRSRQKKNSSFASSVSRKRAAKLAWFLHA